MKQQSWYTHIVVDSRGFCRKSYVPTKYPFAYRFSCETFFCKKKCDCRKPKPKPKCDIVKAPNLVIEAKKINCCFLTGVVRCSTDNNAPVENAVVFAIRQSDGKVFSGVTNADGRYYICVPSGNMYRIECFYCCPDCLEDAPCICNA